MVRGSQQTGKSVNSVELSAAAEFRVQLRRFLHRTEAVTLDAGLTPQRYDLLLMVKSAAGGQTTVGALSGTLDLKQQAVTELVKRAAEAGLIRRQQSQDDGRVFLIELTIDGEQRFERAFQGLADDRAELSRSLEHVRLAFSDTARPPRPRTAKRVDGGKHSTRRAPG